MTPHELKRPIDDVNVLHFGPHVQCWLSKKLHANNGPNFDTVAEVLAFIKDNLADAPAWLVYFGGVRQVDSERIVVQVTLACRRPYRMGPGDRIGKRVAKGSIDEVWPVFETYVRML